MAKSASYWITQLDLLQHPEGGYFKEVYRSNETIPNAGLPGRYESERCFSTSIYFLLTKDQFSSFHKIKSDEIWHFYEGLALTLYLIDQQGNLQEIKLGSTPDNGEVLQCVIPKDTWFSAKATDLNVADADYSLVGCTVAPGFDFSDFELGKREELQKTYSQHSDLITSLTNQ